MKFNYDDKSEPMDLQAFKSLLLKYLMKKSYFQNEPKLELNMLKLPLIIAPSLLGTQVNYDVEKKPLLDQKIEYEPEVFAKFCEMIDDGRVDILGIDDMDFPALVNVAKEMGLVVGKKSQVVLRNEIQNMSKHLLAGQGACHGYIAKRGCTGGFTDAFCDHLFKVASKVHPRQESAR